jgi:hypothetical protein
MRDIFNEPELMKRQLKGMRVTIGDIIVQNAFEFIHKGERMLVLAATQDGWDHVSVSFKDRCPTWDEMEWVKRAFFRPDEVAMQLHVAEADHISFHPYTLHLWRKTDGSIPLPPKKHV